MANVLVTDIPPDAWRAFKRIAKALKSERVAAWAVFGAGIGRVHDQLVNMGEIAPPEAPKSDAPPVETTDRRQEPDTPAGAS